MTAVASVSEWRPRVTAGIRRLGRTFTPEVLAATYSLYEPLQRQAIQTGVVPERDLSYGDHPRQVLDVYMPTDSHARRPMVIYVHGGGFIGGERSPCPGLIYDNVPIFFARHGLVGVNMTYRLAPEHKWPTGALDVGMAVAWARQNADRLGADPDKIFLIGQSAGATHAATWAFVPSVHGPTGPTVTGVILLSGVYAPSHSLYHPAPPQPHQVAYFGADPDRWPEMSPLTHLRPGHPEVFVSVTEFDPPGLQWSSPALVAELFRCDRRMPWFVYARDHNHVSPAMQINLEGDALGPDLLRFISDTCKRLEGQDHG
jgi:acetyl esterase